MGITHRAAKDHIELWTDNLSLTQKSRWPKYLFRHEPLQNAVKVLSSGRLLSRVHAEAVDHIDIAPAAIIHSRNNAHRFGRLYFRPRTPTQFQIEGIRRPDEHYLGEAGAHAPMLVMLVFQAESVLTIDGAGFSNGNMQSPQTEVGDDDEFFRTLDFANIYHDEPRDQSARGQEIKRARCAEVLLPSPFVLRPHLAAILCRSAPERETLLHSLDEMRPDWEAKTRVYTEPGIFFSRYPFVKEFQPANSSIVISCNPRRDGAPFSVGIQITDPDGSVRRFGAYSINDAKRYRVRVDPGFTDGFYLAEVFVDGSLAYKASFLIDDLPF